jgi:hypothetical protein
MGMLNSTILDLAIGMVFVYLLLALLCTTINEWIAGLFGLRAKTLANAIEQLLDGQKTSDPTRSFFEEFYAHPIISGMGVPGKRATTASYLPSRAFATTVMDLVTAGKEGPINYSDLETGVKNLPPGDVRTALLALLQNTQSDLEQAQKNIEQWFDDTMERASGWYKRNTQVVTLFAALLLTVGTNADTLKIGRILWTSGTERTLLVQEAQKRFESGSSDRTITYPNKNNPLKAVEQPKESELKALSALLGWSRDDLRNADTLVWLRRILGWCLSIVAISLGAPFWFDLLSKLMNIRNAGQKPATSKNKADK